MANIPPQGYEKISGSERQPLANARPIGSVDPGESIEVSVYLRAPSTSNLTNVVNEQVQHQAKHLTREEYRARHSAAPEDIAKIDEFARAHDLTIVSTDPVTRRVVLAGTAAAMSSAFATELQRYEYPGGTYRGRTGPLHVPSELDQIVEGVFGLDDRPQAQPRLHTMIRQHVRLGQVLSRLLTRHRNLPNSMTSQPRVMERALMEAVSVLRLSSWVEVTGRAT